MKPDSTAASDKWVKKFLTHLATDRGASAYTQRNYEHGLREFGAWHQQERQGPPAWDRLERDSQTRLLQITGGLFIGPPDGDLVSGSLASATAHGLAHEMLGTADIRKRYPVFEAQPHEVALYEDRAGVLLAERCIEAHLRLADMAGAELHHAERVRAWTTSGDGVEVETDRGRYSAGRVVIAVGAWAGKLAGRVIPPGPENPIKSRWIGITGGAGIHGTVETGSLGTNASHGCIRMSIPDVEELFDRVPYGSTIFIH